MTILVKITPHNQYNLRQKNDIHSRNLTYTPGGGYLGMGVDIILL